MGKWKSIKSAPKSPLKRGFASNTGPRFLAYPVSGLVAGVRWSESISRGEASGDFVADWNQSCNPTHWQPLPSPPKDSE